MKRKSSVLLGLLCSALCLLLARPAVAQNAKPPTQLTYQGFLTDGNGVPFGNTTPVNKTVIFRIYDGPNSGATLKWSSQQVVTVDKGYFSALLGQGSAVGSDPAGSFNADLTGVFTGASTVSDRYLELNADGTTIAPRLRFLPAPYAMLAKSATELLDPVYGTNSLSISGGNLTVGGTINGNNVNVSNLGASGNITASGKIVATGNITASGYVGIGTTTPGAKLEIDGDNNSPPLVTLKMTTTSWGTPDIYNNFRYISTQAAATDSSFKQFNVGAGGVSIGYGNVPIYGSSDALYVNGNVGIGTNAPGSKLHVAGDIQLSGGDLLLNNSRSLKAKNAAGSYESFLVPRDTDNISYLNYGSSGFNLRNNGGTSTMFMNNSGNVGIGTTSLPRARLEISGGVSGAGETGTYFFGSSTVGSGGGSFQNAAGHGSDHSYSLWLSDQARIGAFIVIASDVRVKKIEGRSNGKADLATLLGIEVTDYRYKDVIGKGNTPQKKVVAQQVELVFPQAVKQATDVVPDIYQKATHKDGWVELVTDLKPGERVRLIGEKEEAIYEVIEIRNGAFRTSFKPVTANVFVYGREVKDFRHVDYDAIAMLNVSATQELARQVEALRKSEERIAELEQKVSKLTALEGELAEMKRLLTRLSEPRKDGRPAVEVQASDSKAGAAR